MSVIQDTMDLADQCIRGGYRGFNAFFGDRLADAKEFAERINNNKRLYRSIRADLNGVREALEDSNYHTANIGLNMLFDKRAFLKYIADTAKFYIKSELK